MLINLSVKINSHKLCAFVIWLNMRKLKSVKSSSGNKKKKKFWFLLKVAELKT